ncbi:MAG: molybdopterin molybdotransferase MoeA [Lachnospiraceae bacterium]|nr:molybdopterin molybdotransferase MoeA [Lachnospiraceae bacterium]
MLNVKTPEEVLSIMENNFSPVNEVETISIYEADSRVLAKDILSVEFVPSFDRSTVDGYAVYASDTFGCSDSIPAMLPVSGEILMGESADAPLEKGYTVSVPTGGAIPEGADSVCMVEYTEDYGDGTIGITKSVAPGENIIYKGDDVFPGKLVLPKGRKLTASDIGALAAMGITKVCVSKKLVVGIISTGDELVDISETPVKGQIRDLNSSMLCALVKKCGAAAIRYGFFKDDETVLSDILDKALSQCDMVLISGGSSVGLKDATTKIIEQKGELLFHGIAMKPGKPTILGKAGNKPIFGLPGHPVAAFLITHIFARPLIYHLMGKKYKNITVPAILTETVSANHGRAQYTGVFLEEREGKLFARPIRGKSGLITTLAASDGYFAIDRDCEGLKEGSIINVTLYSLD